MFLGKVKTKHGEIYGLWQRPAQFGALKWRKRASPKLEERAINTSGQMKLLVAFHKPVQTKKRLEFGPHAQAIVLANFNRVFGAELAKAIATSTNAR